jgi:23S rRNA (cytidine1920-2'-O)/16S rRNA (cytidine1409-2'-O)-methyltransferase
MLEPLSKMVLLVSALLALYLPSIVVDGIPRLHCLRRITGQRQLLSPSFCPHSHPVQLISDSSWQLHCSVDDARDPDAIIAPVAPKSKSNSKKRRVDELLIERHLAADKREVDQLAMSGSLVLEDNGEVIHSSSMKIDASRQIRLRLRRNNEPYVSRAGRKLAHAVEVFELGKDIDGQLCIDLGSSTGGFSDVLLQNNCKRVYAVDVGVSLLDWKIRNDPRVALLEKQNARYLNATTLLPGDADNVGVVVCDVSFISLKLVLPPSLQLCKEQAILCALIKPQFECKRQEIGDGGIVRDEAARKRVVDGMLDWFRTTHPDWKVLGTVESPITGHDGNVEYLLVARKQSKGMDES